MILQNTSIDFNITDEINNKFNSSTELIDNDKILVVEEGYSEISEIDPGNGADSFEYVPAGIGAIDKLKE